MIKVQAVDRLKMLQALYEEEAAYRERQDPRSPEWDASDHRCFFLAREIDECVLGRRNQALNDF